MSFLKLIFSKIENVFLYKKYLYLFVFLLFILLLGESYFLDDDFLEPLSSKDFINQQVEKDIIKDAQLIYPLERQESLNINSYLNDYYLYEDQIDLEEITKNEFLSKSSFSNEINERIIRVKKDIFTTKKFFEYDDEIFKKQLEDF